LRDATANNEWLEKDLAAGTHYWKVRSKDEFGNTSSYTSQVQQTLTDTLPAPGWIASSVSGQSIFLRWDPMEDVHDIERFEVERDSVIVALKGSPAKNTLSDKGLTDNKSPGYSYRVRAVDIYGNISAWSSAHVQTVPADVTPPIAPTWVETSVSGRAVRLLWDPIETDTIDHFEIERDSVVIGKSSNNTYTDNGLPDASYPYRIRAVDKSENIGPWSAATIQTVPNDTVPPGAPSAVRAVLSTDGVLITWSNPPQLDIAFYRIYVGTSGSGPWTIIGKKPYGQVFNHRQVAGGSTYYYKVTAIDQSDNESADSNIVSVVVALPLAPSNVRSQLSGNDIVLVWDHSIERNRFQYFEILKLTLGLNEEFNYSGVPDTAIWTIQAGTPSVNGSDLVIKSDGSTPDELFSISSFLYTTIELRQKWAGAIGHAVNWFGMLTPDLQNGFWFEAVTIGFLINAYVRKNGVTSGPFLLGTLDTSYHKFKFEWFIDLGAGSTPTVKIYFDDVLKATETTNVPTTSIPIWFRGTRATAGDVNIDWVTMSANDFAVVGTSKTLTFRDKSPVFISDPVYKIRTVHVLNETADSEEHEVTGLGAPTQPTGLRVAVPTAADGTFANRGAFQEPQFFYLTWYNNPEDDISHYEVWFVDGEEVLTPTWPDDYHLYDLMSKPNNNPAMKLWLYLYPSGSFVEDKHIAIIAVNDRGEKSPAAFYVLTGTAGDQPSQAPINFSGSVSGQNVPLHWSHPDFGSNMRHAIKILVERKVGAGAYSTIGVIPITSTSFTDSNLTTGAYTYRLSYSTIFDNDGSGQVTAGPFSVP